MCVVHGVLCIVVCCDLCVELCLCMCVVHRVAALACVFLGESNLVKIGKNGEKQEQPQLLLLLLLLLVFHQFFTSSSSCFSLYFLYNMHPSNFFFCIISSVDSNEEGLLIEGVILWGFCLCDLLAQKNTFSQILRIKMQKISTHPFLSLNPHI